MSERTWCCVDMRDEVETYLDCDQRAEHRDAFDCDHTLIHRSDTDIYGLIYHGEHVGIRPINFCPFCGAKLLRQPPTEHTIQQSKVSQTGMMPSL